MKFRVTVSNVENLKQGDIVDSADFSPKELERLQKIGAFVKHTTTKKDEVSE